MRLHKTFPATVGNRGCRNKAYRNGWGLTDAGNELLRTHPRANLRRMGEWASTEESFSGRTGLRYRGNLAWATRSPLLWEAIPTSHLLPGGAV
jgi:hypothetical protein